ncbi:conjugal transfer protein [Mycoplasma cottewii]|uniref:Conjugal transfer protein n=1 Tax=Mycoplasma cottewii TaxID=51364 RepID=A0ABY5TZW1_9MOLU|nr:conjugal transfer protein [Mycoplasma cottewii]UWD34763.1 conjugal transfer protein [Mycoplasma cottewii]
MELGFVMITIIFSSLIAILSLVLLLTEYKECFSKNKLTRAKARAAFKWPWITTLAILVLSVWLVLIMVGAYLI